MKTAIPPAPHRRTWDGRRDVTQAELMDLTGLRRTQLYRDRLERMDSEGGRYAPLLGAPVRRPGVRGLIFPAATVRRYLAQKFPHLLPPR